MDVRHRLEYARKVRGKTRHRIFQELKESGPNVPNRTKRDVYAFFSDTARKTPPLPTLEALALILEVRAAWLAFGEGPMEAGVPSDPERELFLVDGAPWRFNPYLDPEERRWDRQSFHASFRSAEGFEKLSYAGRAAFSDYLARYFERAREEGRYQDSATWRGQEAATQFLLAVDMVRERQGTEGDPEKEPISTGEMLWALGSLEMQTPTDPWGAGPNGRR